MKYDDELILKAAWYYYIENMTQQAIASKLEISRMKVIRLLDVARETGVIQFRISLIWGNTFRLNRPCGKVGSERCSHHSNTG